MADGIEATQPSNARARDVRGARETRAGWAARIAARLGRLPALVAAIVLLAAPPAATAQTAVLGGGYVGIDEAEGWQMQLYPLEVEGQPGFEGVFIDETGQTTGFVALDGPGGAEAQVAFSDGVAYFRISPRPIGAILAWIPIDATGNLAVEAAATFPFIRDDVAVPPTPKDIAAAPIEIGSSYSSIAFVKSYEFWTPEETGRAYASLTERSRTLIKLYATVHTDVLWKLCQARSTPPGLAEALEGQALDCPALLGSIADIQSRGRFSAYKTALAPEKSALLDAMRCATGLLRPQELCVAVARGTSERALSLETAATVVARF